MIAERSPDLATETAMIEAAADRAPAELRTAAAICDPVIIAVSPRLALTLARRLDRDREFRDDLTEMAGLLRKGRRTERQLVAAIGAMAIVLAILISAVIAS